MGYSSTLAVLGYVYLGETSTVLLRAKTTGVAAGSTGFLNLIVGYCSPLMLTSPNFGVSSTSESAMRFLLPSCPPTARCIAPVHQFLHSFTVPTYPFYSFDSPADPPRNTEEAEDVHSPAAFFYASTCLFCLVVSYFTIPETKGRTFGELDELFARRISSRKFAETKTEVDLLRERERALQV